MNHPAIFILEMLSIETCIGFDLGLEFCFVTTPVLTIDVYNENGFFGRGVQTADMWLKRERQTFFLRILEHKGIFK